MKKAAASVASFARKAASAAGPRSEAAYRAVSGVVGTLDAGLAELTYRSTLPAGTFPRDTFPEGLPPGFLTTHCQAMDRLRISQLPGRAASEVNHLQGSAMRAAAAAAVSSATVNSTGQGHWRNHLGRFTTGSAASAAAASAPAASKSMLGSLVKKGKNAYQGARSALAGIGESSNESSAAGQGGRRKTYRRRQMRRATRKYRK
jgi:hypothetical protein